MENSRRTQFFRTPDIPGAGVVSSAPGRLNNSRRTQFFRTPDILAIETAPRRAAARQRLGRAVRRMMENRLSASPGLRFLRGADAETNRAEFTRFLRRYAGQRVRMRYIMRGLFFVDDDLIELDKMVTVPDVLDDRAVKEFAQIHLVVYDPYGGGDVIIPEQDGYRGYLSIVANQQGGIDYGEQNFQHGYTNCVLRHIDSWLNSLPEKSTNRKSGVKKMVKLWEQWGGGVPETALQGICDELIIGIKVVSPYSRTEIVNVKKEGVKKLRRTFTFVNTRQDHVELVDTIETFPVTQEEMDDLFELKSDGTIWKQTRDGVVFYMRDGVREYVIREEEAKETIDFKKSIQGFDPREHELLKDFIHYSMLHMGTVDGEDVASEDTLHIDQKNSYASYKSSKYYTGVPAFITDNVQACDRIWGEGFYFVEKFTNLGRLAEVNKFLGGIFVNRNVYPANILKMLSDLGGEYIITSGCWGNTRDLTFPAEMIENKDYQKYIGVLGTSNEYNAVRVHNVNYNWLRGVEKLVTRFGDIREILLPKKTVTYRGHIASYLIGYCAIQTITQLLTMDLSKVVRVCVDGIYTNQKDVKCTGSFRFKNDLKFGNAAGGKYFPLVHPGLNREQTFLFPEKGDPVSLFPHRINLAYGAGGSGKTYYCQYEDIGSVDVLFVNPSHELCAANPNVQSVTHQKLLTDLVGRTGAPNWVGISHKYSEFVLDEASMLTKQQYDKLIERFPYHKFIFAGDLGFQLPPVMEGDELYEEDFPHRVEFTKDRRSLDKETKRFKKRMREMMREGCGVMALLEELWNTTCVKRPQKYTEWRDAEKRRVWFPKLNDDVESVIWDFVGKDFGYQETDMIIANTHKICDEYTMYFSPAKTKYKVLKNTKYFQNGNIIYDVPKSLNPSHYELRHGFTIHSAQGKTLKKRIFIDVRRIQSTRMLYTAISRAHKLSQIVLLDGIEPREKKDRGEGI